MEDHYMFDELYKAVGLDGEFQVWYTTVKRKLKKSKSFNDLKEVGKWCKQNKGKVIVTSGSLLVLQMFENQ